jgi:hypothetical protein
MFLLFGFALNSHRTFVHFCLQVLYFDSVDAGDQTVDPSVWPRICEYNSAKLFALVERDTLNCPSMRVFGKLRVSLVNYKESELFCLMQENLTFSFI